MLRKVQREWFDNIFRRSQKGNQKSPSEKSQDALELYKQFSDFYIQASDEGKKLIAPILSDILNNKSQDKPAPIDKSTTTAYGSTSSSNAHPSQGAMDFAWKTIVIVASVVFCLATVGIFFAAISEIWFKPTTINSDLFVTIFGTSIGFLAGILTPRPEGRR